MKKVILVALVSGSRKDGVGKWYRATLKGHNKEGNPVVNAFYLSEEVGDKAVRDGIVEDCEVKVLFDFDDYMRPTISELTKITAIASAKGSVST